MPEEITVRNWRRSRSFGWGYSTKPTGKDSLSVALPTQPAYTGTYRQVCEAIRSDPNYASLRDGAYYLAAWFYQGRRITHTKIDRWYAGFTALDDADLTIHVM